MRQLKLIVPRGTFLLRALHLICLSIFCTLLISCEKPDPMPEARDPIYQDMLAQLSMAEKNLQDAEKKKLDQEKELSIAKPQTGEYKRAQARLYEASHAVDIMKQQTKYWKIRILERRKTTRLKYLRAYKDKKPWPDPSEYSEYLAEGRLRKAKLNWDVKQRIADSGALAIGGKSSSSTGGGHGSAPAQSNGGH